MKALTMFLMMALFIGQAANAADLNCVVKRTNHFTGEVRQDYVNIPVSFRNPALGVYGRDGQFIVANSTVNSYLIPNSMLVWYSVENRNQFGQKRLGLGLQDSFSRAWLSADNSFGPRCQLRPVRVQYSKNQGTLEVECELTSRRCDGFGGMNDGLDD